MAFINEFVSEQDIEKYHLDDLWNKYNRRGEQMPELRLSGSYKHYWTIDREQRIWLMFLGMVYSSEPEFSRSGYPEPTGERVFILSFHDQLIEIKLKKSENSTISIYDVPYRIEWQLLSIIPTQLDDLEHRELLSIIRDALKVFGDDGIKWQVANTIVKFEF